MHAGEGDTGKALLITLKVIRVVCMLLQFVGATMLVTSKTCYADTLSPNFTLSEMT